MIYVEQFTNWYFNDVLGNILECLNTNIYLKHIQIRFVALLQIERMIFKRQEMNVKVSPSFLGIKFL